MTSFPVLLFEWIALAASCVVLCEELARVIDDVAIPLGVGESEGIGAVGSEKLERLTIASESDEQFAQFRSRTGSADDGFDQHQSRIAVLCFESHVDESLVVSGCQVDQVVTAAVDRIGHRLVSASAACEERGRGDQFAVDSESSGTTGPEQELVLAGGQCQACPGSQQERSGPIDDQAFVRVASGQSNPCGGRLLPAFDGARSDKIPRSLGRDAFEQFDEHGVVGQF